MDTAQHFRHLDERLDGVCVPYALFGHYRLDDERAHFGPATILGCTAGENPGLFLRDSGGRTIVVRTAHVAHTDVTGPFGIQRCSACLPVWTEAQARATELARNDAEFGEPEGTSMLFALAEWPTGECQIGDEVLTPDGYLVRADEYETWEPV